MNENGKQPLVEIERLLKRYRHILTEAADTIRTQDVSNYPIFVASHYDLEVGIPLLKEGQIPGDWRINASTLEEFHAKKIIDVEKIDDFRTLYKSHADELCIFLWNTEGVGQFLFLPAA